MSGCVQIRKNKTKTKEDYETTDGHGVYYSK